MRKAIFGGTFDPPHNGHVNLAETVLGAAAVDSIVFVPSWNPPHKRQGPVADYHQRMEMVRLALDGVADTEVSGIEGKLQLNPSFTIDVMQALEQEFPDDELFILIGSDSLKLLHTWHKAREIVRNWPLIVYPRAGQVPTENELVKYWDEDTAARLIESLLLLPSVQGCSTDLRWKFQNSEPAGNELPERVKEYIKKNKLYL